MSDLINIQKTLNNFRSIETPSFGYKRTKSGSSERRNKSQNNDVQKQVKQYGKDSKIIQLINSNYTFKKELDLDLDNPQEHLLRTTNSNQKMFNQQPTINTIPLQSTKEGFYNVQDELIGQNMNLKDYLTRSGNNFETKKVNNDGLFRRSFNNKNYLKKFTQSMDNLHKTKNITNTSNGKTNNTKELVSQSKQIESHFPSFPNTNDFNMMVPNKPFLISDEEKLNQMQKRTDLLSRKKSRGFNFHQYADAKFRSTLNKFNIE